MSDYIDIDQDRKRFVEQLTEEQRDIFAISENYARSYIVKCYLSDKTRREPSQYDMEIFNSVVKLLDKYGLKTYLNGYNAEIDQESIKGKLK